MIHCEEIRKRTKLTREQFEQALWELERNGIVIIEPMADHVFAVYFNPAFLMEVGE